MQFTNWIPESAVSVLMVVLLFSCAPATGTEPAAREGAIAVVELFTSEGCSSCPPADELLMEIGASAEKDGSNIFPIAFHVDYWDQLGWKDRFSSTAASDRQRQYARALGSQLYTPQMVVNGRSEFVGSDRDAAHHAIAAALQTPAVSRVALSIVQISGDEVSIAYKTTDAPVGSVLHLVALQRAGTTQVPRGENSGRTLKHVNIARSIKTIQLDTASGQASLKLPTDLDAKSALLIGYLQDPKSLQIIGAAKADAHTMSEP